MSEPMLVGKVVVVTGGAGLLGRQFCSVIASNGGIALVADRDLAAATSVADELTLAYPGRAEPIAIDITDAKSVRRVIATVETRHARIDAVVNSAYPRNQNYGRKMEDVTYQDFCENVGMHLGGYFLVSQQFASFFRDRGAGNIINVSSIYGTMAPRFEVYGSTGMTMPVEYAAIKSAVIHLTKYLAKYLKGTGIRVNAISPGGILDRQPEEFLARYNAQCLSKGMLDPRDLAGTLLFLLSDASAFVNGQNLVVDDGFSL